MKQILLVEDNPYDAEMTMEALKPQDLDHLVIWLKDGQEALDFLFSQGAHAGREPVHSLFVLLDIKLPRVDGLQVLKQIKSDPGLRSMPVVIFTSSREESDILECYRLGANAYIVKPLTFSDYMKALASMGAFWALVNEQPHLRI
jgi:CheY-like chemotaxis protein